MAGVFGLLNNDWFLHFPDFCFGFSLIVLTSLLNVLLDMLISKDEEVAKFQLPHSGVSVEADCLTLM